MMIAYSGRDSQGHQNIFFVNEDGTGVVQRTFGPDNAMPSWSPDGKYLAYVARNPTTHVTRICIMNADGSGAHAIREGNTPEWSPSGKMIALCDQQDGVPTSNLWIMAPNGSGRVQVTKGHAMRVKPTWSPDGKYLVYAQYNLPGDHVAVWITDLIGNSDQLTPPGIWKNLDASGNVINTAYDANSPSWGRNNKIAFWSGIEHGNGQVWSINPEGTGRTQLTHAPLPSHNDDPTCTPDGRILFTTDRAGAVETWIMDADGKNQRRIVASTAGPLPGWASLQSKQAG